MMENSVHTGLQKKALFIVNPLAGSSSALSFSKALSSELVGWDKDIFYTNKDKPLDSIMSLVEQDQGWQLIFILGGDGTIFHALPLLQKLNAPIIPIPIGSANDLATEIGIVPDVGALIKLANGGQTESIDLLSVNDRAFATVGGVGLGAEVVHSFNGGRNSSLLARMTRKICAKNIYKSIVVKNAFRTKDYTRKYRINANGNDLFVESSAIFVSNTKKLGRDLTMCADASIADGRFEIMVAPRLEPLTLLKSLAELNRGIIPKSFKTIKASACRIEVLSSDLPRNFADGENMGRARILDYRCLPGSLRICH